MQIQSPALPPAGNPLDESPEIVTALIASLRQHTGVDVSEHRRATVQRRIANRMISAHVTDPEHYLRLLDESRQEAFALLERMSIKVSRFYRDRETFNRLRTTVLPALAAANSGRPLRIWSAGCSRGEEPYPLAMLLHDSGIAGAVLATDMDPAALAAAGEACYSQDATADLPTALKLRYLEPAGGGRVRVSASARRLVTLARHDLLAPEHLPSDGQFDLICCRNVLIYFQREAQDRVFNLFAQSLRSSGVLCLGQAEWPSVQASLSFGSFLPGVRLFKPVPGARRAA